MKALTIDPPPRATTPVSAKKMTAKMSGASN